jgi:hypothetical protein
MLQVVRGKPLSNKEEQPCVHCVCLLALSLAACATTPENAGEERAETRKVESDTLAKLYGAQPSAKRVVDEPAGYAVLSNFGMKILVAG